MDTILVLELVHLHAAEAQTRLRLQHHCAHALDHLAPLPGTRALRNWGDMLLARRALRAWRLLRPRPLVNSWARRRLHTDDTPLLLF
jgi:hypothetical protein